MKKISLFLICTIITIFAAGFKPAAADTKIIMAFGDSLTAGTGVMASQAFPAQLEQALRDKGHDVTVINAGVGGETTAGGLTRIEFTLTQKPDYVILELGANDMLRGISPDITERNLRAIMDALKREKIPVLVCGMRSFRNLSLFGDSFQKIFKRVADDYDAAYYPFFLDGVAFESGFNQEDGMHPNAAGVAVIVKNILPHVEDLLEE